MKIIKTTVNHSEISYVVSMPDYKGLRGLLVTKDAHKLYEKYGYEIINDRAMMRSPES